MKKLILVLVLFGFMSCDDGDLTVEALDFDSSTISSCTTSPGVELLFKINDVDALILEVPSTLLVNTVTEIDTPRTAELTAANANAFYRSFNTSVSSSYFCDAIPPSGINVSLEYEANSGTIEVITVAVDSDEDGTADSYEHTITLLNVVFNNDGESIIDENFDYGTFTTSLE